MKLKYFKRLSEEDQLNVLQANAVPLANIIDDEGVYFLFQLESFYLEIFYPTRGTFVLNYFEEIDLLEPYLKLINIDDLNDTPGQLSTEN